MILLFTKIYSVIYRCDSPEVFISMSTRSISSAVVSLVLAFALPHESRGLTRKLTTQLINRIASLQRNQKTLLLRGAHVQPVGPEEEGLCRTIIIVIIIIIFKEEAIVISLSMVVECVYCIRKRKS